MKTFLMTSAVVAAITLGYFVTQDYWLGRLSAFENEPIPRVDRSAVGPEIVARTETDGEFSLTLHSGEYTLDRVFMSMHGPRGNHPNISLTSGNHEEAETENDPIVWLTGIETELIDAETLQPISPEFFCHSNLTFAPEGITPEEHNRSFDSPLHAEWRLFTLVPGRMSIRLPEGFGVPLRRETAVDYFTMALNQNSGLADRTLRMRTVLSGRAGTERTLQPLFRRALYVYQQHQSNPETFFAIDLNAHAGELCGELCTGDLIGATASWKSNQPFDTSTHPGETCCVINASEDGVMRQFGSENTVHWMVPPGTHIYRTEVTEQLRLPSQTTAHYITGHLHPYGTALRLVDMDSGEVIFEITATCREDRLGVLEMSETLSEEGIKLTQNRRYELIAEYNNTTAEPIDAMGILYVYLKDNPVARK